MRDVRGEATIRPVHTLCVHVSVSMSHRCWNIHVTHDCGYADAIRRETLVYYILSFLQIFLLTWCRPAVMVVLLELYFIKRISGAQSEWPLGSCSPLLLRFFSLDYSVWTGDQLLDSSIWELWRLLGALLLVYELCRQFLWSHGFWFLIQSALWAVRHSANKKTERSKSFLNVV